MHPDYEVYRKQPRELGNTRTFRAPDRLVTLLGIIARAEEDNLSDLLIEGVARICESRQPGAVAVQVNGYEFTKRRPREPTSPITGHFPKYLDCRLQKIAIAEEVGIPQLVYEGMGRVILDRQANIEVLEKRQQDRHRLESTQLRSLTSFSPIAD